MHSDIDEFRLRIRAYLTSLGVIGSLSFAIYQLLTGDTLGSFLSFMCGVYFGLVVYLLIKHRRYLWEGRGYAIFLSVTLLNLIKSFPEYGIYWAYVWVTYIFLLMRFKEALFATGIFIPLALYFVNDHYPTEVLIRIYATLFLVGVYAIVFSSLIERLLDRVNILITQDPLTKALNRSVFYNSVETALFSFRRYNIPTSLFLFDLDHFKKINDDYGHLAGDRVLEKMSECVRTRLRQSDQFFRYGGEEFAILLTNTLQEDAMLFAEDIRKLIKDQNFGIGRHVTISGGVSQACSEDEVNTWIDRCDKALYQAKLRDRNRVLLASKHTNNG
jgi:diguanylate cyclase (GGDEF)-like protein